MKVKVQDHQAATVGPLSRPHVRFILQIMRPTPFQALCLFLRERGLFFRTPFMFGCPSPCLPAPVCGSAVCDTLSTELGLCPVPNGIKGERKKGSKWKGEEQTVVGEGVDRSRAGFGCPRLRETGALGTLAGAAGGPGGPGRTRLEAALRATVHPVRSGGNRKLDWRYMMSKKILLGSSTQPGRIKLKRQKCGTALFR